MRIILATFLAVLLTLTPALAQFFDYLTFVTVNLSNTAQAASVSNGPFLAYNCYNPNVTTTYVQMFDSIGVVTVGTTPAVRFIPLAAQSTTGMQVPSPPLAFVAGMQVAATTTQSNGVAPALPVACEFYYR